MDYSGPNYIAQEQQEEFEYFLLGHMNIEEEISFNKRLEKEPLLKSQFKEFKTLFLTVEEQALRMKLDEFHDNFEKRSKSKKSNFTIYRIAAGIAVLLSLGLWFLNRPNQNERLFLEYFSPDPGLPTVMGNNDNYPFYEAMVDYKEGNYDVAIKKWRGLLVSKPNNDTLNYFLGVAHLANDDSKSAIPYLEKIDVSESFFGKDAKHYLGLAHLKSGDIEKAKALLEKDSEVIKSLD